MSSIAQSSWFISNGTIHVKTERLLPTFWKQVTSFNREHGLEALRTLLGLCQTSSSALIINNLALDCEDAVFVVIDTEGFRQRVRELGVYSTPALFESSNLTTISQKQYLHSTTQHGNTIMATRSGQYFVSEKLNTSKIPWLAACSATYFEQDPPTQPVKNLGILFLLVILSAPIWEN
jgi:hypothetical protein